MKYVWIKKYRDIFPIVTSCKVLNVSTSGFYHWIKRPLSNREKRHNKLTSLVHKSFLESSQVYGYRKVYEDLQQEYKVSCCKETVRVIMHENRLFSKVKRKFVVTTDSRHDYKVAENILDRNFTVRQPNQVWVTDITYIRTQEGWLYLAGVMDLFGRRIVGWAMSKHIDAQLVKDALAMAVEQRGTPKSLLLHSDRGSQYCSDDYQNMLTDTITCSMSRKGNCWDNAVMESFFGSLKTEWIRGRIYETRTEAEKDVFIYIEMFYNRKRRHASLGYVSPVEFELRYELVHVA